MLVNYYLFEEYVIKNVLEKYPLFTKDKQVYDNYL